MNVGACKARHRLNDTVMGGKVGPEDVKLSVFGSFFRRQAGDQFDQHSWDSLWSLLATIALRKCSYAVRHYRTAGRDVRREIGAAESEDSVAPWQALARDPTPSEAAMLTEMVE